MGGFELSVEELRARPGAKWHRYGEDVIPAWIAEMDFTVAEPIQAALRRWVDAGVYGYDDAGLATSLADTFASYMQRRFGWDVGSEHVLPLADLVQAQFATVAAFTERGDGVVLQTPIYPPFINSVRDMGRHVVEHRPVDDGSRYVLDAASLRELVNTRTPLMMLCNPHNPTGRSYTRAELAAVAEIALERDLVVLSDEVHADLTYAGQTHIPFGSLGPDIAARTITITSATKAYNIPGLRCGVMHFGSTALRERFAQTLPDRLLGKVNRSGVEATLAAWRDSDDWLQDVRTVLAENRQRLAQTLVAKLPEVRHYSPDASYLAWLDCRQMELSPSPYAFFLERARVALNDGAEFGPPGKGHVRLNFATSPEILDELLGRMTAAVHAHARIAG